MIHNLGPGAESVHLNHPHNEEETDPGIQRYLATTGVLTGPDGLRPGWGILIFLFLLATLGGAVNDLTARAHQAFHNAASRDTLHKTRSAGAARPPAAETMPLALFETESSALLVVTLATLALWQIERRPSAVYGLAETRRLPHVSQGLLHGIAALSLLVATLRVTGHLSIDARLLPTPAALQYGAIWAIGFALVALAEELSVRGYLQSTLTRGLHAIITSISDTPHARAWAFWSAAALLSFLFGLLHTSNPGESPLGLLSAGLAGLVFSLALYRTGSIWWAIGFHTTWDWAQSFLYGVPDSGTMVQHHLLATHPIGSPILSGGLTGPEGSIFILPTLALVAVIIVLTLPQRDLTQS